MKQILIVEDDVHLAELISNYLSCHDFSSEIVYSGNSAISFLEKESVDLIISDIRMKNGSGIDLMRWNAQQLEITSFIAISGDVISRDETIQFCEVMGVPHLAKPFLMEKLLSVVKSTFSQLL